MNTPDLKQFIFISILLIAIVILFIFLYFIYEKREKKKIKERFKKFSAEYQISKKEMRGAQRISIPDYLEILLHLNTNTGKSPLQGSITNISLSGMAIKPDFPLKKLPIGNIFVNVTIRTPIFNYHVAKIENIRFEHNTNKRIMGFKILEISDSDFELHKKLLHYFVEFIKNEMH